MNHINLLLDTLVHPLLYAVLYLGYGFFHPLLNMTDKEQYVPLTSRLELEILKLQQVEWI